MNEQIKADPIHIEGSHTMPLNCQNTQDFFKVKSEACMHFSRVEVRCTECPFFAICHNLADTPRGVSEVIRMAQEWHSEREELFATTTKEVTHDRS